MFRKCWKCPESGEQRFPTNLTMQAYSLMTWSRAEAQNPLSQIQESGEKETLSLSNVHPHFAICLAKTASLLLLRLVLILFRTAGPPSVATATIAIFNNPSSCMSKGSRGDGGRAKRRLSGASCGVPMAFFPWCCMSLKTVNLRWRGASNQ